MGIEVSVSQAHQQTIDGSNRNVTRAFPPFPGNGMTERPERFSGWLWWIMVVFILNFYGSRDYSNPAIITDISYTILKWLNNRDRSLLNKSINYIWCKHFRQFVGHDRARDNSIVICPRAPKTSQNTTTITWRHICKFTTERCGVRRRWTFLFLLRQWTALKMQVWRFNNRYA